LVVGAGKVAADIVARVRSHRELGYQIVGCLSKDGSEKRGERGIPVIGSYNDLKSLLATMDIDQVIVALPLEDHHEMPQVIEQIGDSLIDLKIVPDVYQFVRVGGRIEEFEGLPVISVQESPLDTLSLFAKRVVDVLVASAALLVLSPFLLFISVLIKLTSPGPIFYGQERLSYDGTRFKILKFRSMRIDAEEHGPGWTTKGDARVTWLGKILRSTSVDELPQLWNVLRGDMSLVGPRPERPVFIDEFRKRVPRYMLRHKVPAGMTGWAQIHGWRGDTSIDKRIEFDLYYIENWSILLDFKILCLTVLRGFFHRNAC
jgi:Undecaprenyl-phosphate glucose phosphotransferase